jgi:DNA-binding response OmpR family regulator
LKSRSNPFEAPRHSLEEPSIGVTYHFEGYELDCLLRQLRWHDENLDIARESFDLLLYLVKVRPRIVDKAKLMEAVWPGQSVKESDLAQQISVLQQTLSKSDSGRVIIEAVPSKRLGWFVFRVPDKSYRFGVVVEEVSGPNASPELRQTHHTDRT